MPKLPFICFVHIEKAGGMTSHQILHRSIPGYISPHPGFQEHLTAPELKKLLRFWPFRTGGIGGHRLGAFLNYEEVISRPIFYFSFLRDPMKRYMSSINWKTHLMHQDWTPESYGQEPYYYNFQCFRLSGERSFAKAKEIILKKYAFIGLMEEFNASLLVWKNLLGAPHFDLRYVKDNVRDYGEKTIYWEDLSPRVQAQYLENNAEDQKLYDFVKNELWPAYLARYEGDLQQDLKAFEESLTTFKRPRREYYKQKISNALLGRIWQPLLYGPQKPVR
jgi:hypothetical protein